MAIDCTPSERLSTYRCLECATESQLLIAAVLALAKHRNAGYNMPEDTNQLMTDSACWTCLTDKQLVQAVVSAISEWVSAEEWESVMEEIKCLQCANPKQIKAALAYLICKIISGLTDE